MPHSVFAHADFGSCVKLKVAYLRNTLGVLQRQHLYNGPLRPTNTGPLAVHPECTGGLADDLPADQP